MHLLSTVPHRVLNHEKESGGRSSTQDCILQGETTVGEAPEFHSSLYAVC